MKQRYSLSLSHTCTHTHTQTHTPMRMHTCPDTPLFYRRLDHFTLSTCKSAIHSAKSTWQDCDTVRIVLSSLLADWLTVCNTALWPSAASQPSAESWVNFLDLEAKMTLFTSCGMSTQATHGKMSPILARMLFCSESSRHTKFSTKTPGGERNVANSKHVISLWGGVLRRQVLNGVALMKHPVYHVGHVQAKPLKKDVTH